MKRFLLITFSIFFLTAAGGYFYFIHFGKKADIWQLIPGTAIMVFEHTNAIDSWNQLLDKELWPSLQQIPKFDDFSKTIEAMDSLTGGLRRFLKRRILVSVALAWARYLLI